MALGADCVPTNLVTAFIFGDVGFVGLQRPVRRGERGVEEEWIRARAGGELIDVLRGMIADGVGVVETFAGARTLVAVDKRDGIEVVACPGDGSKVTLEASLHGPVVFRFKLGRGQVPLAGHRGPVSGTAKDLGKRYAVLTKVAAV